MKSNYDPDTDISTAFEGYCSYCQIELYNTDYNEEELGIHAGNYTHVRRQEQIIRICNNCISDLYRRGELIEIGIIENSSGYSYEFIDVDSAEDDIKKKRRFV